MKRVAQFREPSLEAITKIVAENRPEAELVRPWETEICFVPMADSFVRMRGSRAEGISAQIRAMTYRCGACWAPVSEKELSGHFDEHAAGKES